MKPGTEGRIEFTAKYDEMDLRYGTFEARVDTKVTNPDGPVLMASHHDFFCSDDEYVKGLDPARAFLRKTMHLELDAWLDHLEKT